MNRHVRFSACGLPVLVLGVLLVPGLRAVESGASTPPPPPLPTEKGAAAAPRSTSPRDAPAAELQAADPCDDDLLRQRVNTMVAWLGSDEYRERLDAQARLASLPGASLSMLEAHAERTADLEVRVRLRLVIRAIALNRETDPDRLAVYAREDARAGRYGRARDFYDKAAAEYSRRALACTEPRDEAKWRALTCKAEERSQRVQLILNLSAREESSRAPLFDFTDQACEGGFQLVERDEASLILITNTDW